MARLRRGETRGGLMRKLEALTAQWLLENPLEKPGWVVEGLD